ncbi:MAG: response regulator [Planctomycetia bacterium]|jgi:DNA-binding NtrC family response regulator
METSIDIIQHEHCDEQDLQHKEQKLASTASNLDYLLQVIQETNVAEKVHSGKASILLIDEELHALRKLAKAFHKHPYIFDTAPSAKEAFVILERQPINVVIADAKTADMPGIELAHQIMQKHPDTKTILLTDRDHAHEVGHAFHEGYVFRFFVKPCNAFDLVLAIYDAIEKK